jgi:hypothetical protein
MPVPLTTGAPSPVSAQKIEYTNHLPEYPQTHPQGYAYVINFHQSQPEKIRSALTSVSNVN